MALWLFLSLGLVSATAETNKTVSVGLYREIYACCRGLLVGVHKGTIYSFVMLRKGKVVH